MNIELFRTGDIAAFLVLAAAERWVADPWEFEFLLSTFPQGCFAAHTDNGEIAGFVTSIRHERSGWVGNLIVAGEHRGRGIGEKLFTAAIGALRTAGVDTFWLTASKSGAPLYEKFGFSSIDTIIRWVGEGRQRHTPGISQKGPGVLDSAGAAVDYQAWGDRRDALLAATVGRGRLLHDGSGFISLQPYGDTVQIGPFSAVDSCGAARLFENATGSVTLGTRIFVDAPVSNRSALHLFNRKRMKIAGKNLLMYAGKKPEYRPELIYGLATLGSCG